MSLLLLLCAPAMAGGMHAGIALDQVEGLGPIEHLDPALGLTAPVLADGRPVGVVRLRVARDPADAAGWLDQALAAVQAPADPLVLGDRGFQVGDRVAGFVDGNVALTVTLGPDAAPSATDLAVRLHARIADQPAAWPAPPTHSQRTDGLWTFQGPDGSTLTFVGGRQPLGERDGFSALPEQVVAWDAWGRASVLDLGD